MFKIIALPLIFGALLTIPAMAAPACSGSYGMSKDFYTEAEINSSNLDALRSRGVDVTRAELWGGCIRAWVRQADGSEQMQFFEPLTMQRVE